MNPNFGYFEDFGGKVEDKHVNMHIIDLALGELFEESAMMFNLHYDDLKDCKQVLIDFPGFEGSRQYLCFIINYDLKAYYGIRDVIYLAREPNVRVRRSHACMPKHPLLLVKGEVYK